MHLYTRAVRGPPRRSREARRRVLLIGIAVAATAALLSAPARATAAALHEVGSIRRVGGLDAVLRARADQQVQRQTTRARLVLSGAGRTRPARVQSAHRRQRHVRVGRARRPRRARRDDRQGAVDVDAAGHRPRAGVLGKQGSLGPPPDPHGEQRHPRSRRAHRTADPDVRHQRLRRHARRHARAQRRPEQQPRTRLRKSAHRRIERRRGLRIAAGRHPRVRRDHRQARVDVSHDSAPRRVRVRNVAGDRLQVRGRREHVGRSHARREERHRLSADRIADARSLRRRSPGRQSVRQLPARARRAHGKAAVAFSDRASRSVGLRQRRGAEAADRSAQRQADRHRRAGRQDRISVRVRAENGKAALADRRAAGAEERSARRVLVADAADSRPSRRRSRGSR